MKPLTSDYSGKKEFKKKEIFKMQDGSVTYRILPAFSTFTDNANDWKVFHNIHFGYKNTEGQLRPFESPLVKNHKTKMIEVPDAALDRLNDLKAKLAQAKVDNNAPAVAGLNLLVGPKNQVYNMDNNMHMNAVDLQGNIGVLQIRYKAFLALEAEIKKLKAQGIDPLSLDDGRFFTFTRTGMGNQTTFSVAVARDASDKQMVSNLSPEIRSRLESEVQDLFNLAARPTAEEVAQIVAESDLRTGKSPACNRIFDDRWKANREAKNQTQTASTAPTANPQTVTPTMTAYVAPTQTPVAAPAAVSTASTVAPQTIIATPTAAVQTVMTPVTQPVTQPTGKTQAAAIEELSDDDFFKQIGVTA